MKSYSVIIPTYNSAKYIAESVGSALRQTVKPHEVVVVDDGSTDNTKDVLRDYIDSKKIIYLKRENGGSASARNYGIKHSTGDLIAILDADDIWRSDKMEKQLLMMESVNANFVYSGRIEFIDGTNYEDGRVINIFMPSGDVTVPLLKNNFITNSSIVMSKHLFGVHGYFNETDNANTIEDYEYWFRMVDKEYFAVVVEPLVYYRIHEGQISATKFNLVLRNLILLFFNLLIEGRFKEYRLQLIYKIIQNIKALIMSKIKSCLKK